MIADVLKLHGVDPDPVFAKVETGEPLTEYRKMHEHLQSEHKAFGVPTFIVG